MKNFSTFIAILLLFSSCKTNDDLSAEKESYSFQRIGYYAADSNREVTTIDIPEITYSNATGEEQRYLVNPLESYYDTSLFESEDAEAFAVDSIELSVPYYIDEYNTIYVGTQKWKYSNVMQQQKLPFDTSLDIDLPPNTMVVINEKIFFSTYKTNYRLLLRGEQTGTEKIIEGTWTGTHLDKVEGSVSWYNLQSSAPPYKNTVFTYQE